MIKIAIRHIIIVIVSVVILLGVPIVSSDSFRAWAAGDVDAMSAATEILDTPSGKYVVLINKDRHSEDNLSVWEDFFSGKDIDIIFEDIDCYVSSSDLSGFEIARSLQSRLPENQMEVSGENITLILSKAKHGCFDVIVMSEETAESADAKTLYDNENIDVIQAG